MSSLTYKLNDITARMNKLREKATKYCNRSREMKKAVKSRDLTISNLRARWHKLTASHAQEISTLKEEHLDNMQADKKKIEQLEYQVTQLAQADDAKKNS